LDEENAGRRGWKMAMAITEKVIQQVRAVDSGSEMLDGCARVAVSDGDKRGGRINLNGSKHL
jgi:hypothetical protein